MVPSTLKRAEAGRAFSTGAKKKVVWSGELRRTSKQYRKMWYRAGGAYTVRQVMRSTMKTSAVICITTCTTTSGKVEMTVRSDC